MTFLETWVDTPVAEAVGWALLHSLWQGAVIGAALGAALLALRSPRARYAVACAALLAIAAGFGLTLARMLPDSARDSTPIMASALPSAMNQTGVEAASPPDARLAAAVPWLAPLWAAGVWLSCLWHVAGGVSVRRLRRRGVCCAPSSWQQQLERLSAQMHLSKPVQLLESCLVEAPIVLGHLRPLILMPVGLLAQLPPEQIEAILLHELAHIRRCDYLVNVLQRAVEGLLFYHPAVWWISAVIRAERENCCDDVVVAMRGNAREYAVALAALEQNRWPGEAAVAATGGNLVKRIRRLLYPKQPQGAWAPLLAVVVLMASASLGLAVWAASPPQPPAAVPQGGTPAAEAGPYARWLNEDVVYIIADVERAAFESLTSDAEREKFIEQFWERRDPTPGSAANEFKQEHYRRIDFGNRRYQTAYGRPGWLTDRGRIYIVYGPPDEIESHPSGSPNRPYPFSIWAYRHVEGLGDNLTITFIDPTKTGDYRIAPGNSR